MDACTLLLHLQRLLTRNVLPQASVLLMGKENLTTGGVTDSSKVPLHFGWSNMWLRMSRDSLKPAYTTGQIWIASPIEDVPHSTEMSVYSIREGKVGQ